MLFAQARSASHPAKTNPVRRRIQINLLSDASQGYWDGVKHTLGILLVEAEQAYAPRVKGFARLPKFATAFGGNLPSSVVATERGVLLERSTSGELRPSEDEDVALARELRTRNHLQAAIPVSLEHCRREGKDVKAALTRLPRFAGRRSFQRLPNHDEPKKPPHDVGVFSSQHGKPLGLIAGRIVFGEILVIVGVGYRLGWIADGEVVRIGLSVAIVTGSGYDIEVAGFMHQRAGA